MAGRNERFVMRRIAVLLVLSLALVTGLPSTAGAETKVVPGTSCWLSFWNGYEDVMTSTGGGPAHFERRHTAQATAYGRCASLTISIRTTSGWPIVSRTDRTGLLNLRVKANLRDRRTVKIVYGACDDYGPCGSFNRYHW